MRENSIIYTVLERLAEFGEGTLDAFFPKKYPYAALSRPLFGLVIIFRTRFELIGLDRKKKAKRQTISTILWRLKQQGLVERTGAKKIARWQVTPKGKTELERQALSHLKTSQSDGVARLVIFDIPEQERNKRDAIRAELVGCQFKQLQKSVWIGYCPLPEDFITLIDTLELNGKIHIFSVRDQGTIGVIK